MISERDKMVDAKNKYDELTDEDIDAINDAFPPAEGTEALGQSSIPALKKWKEAHDRRGKDRREAGAKAFAAAETAKVKKHPDDYRYGAQGRSRAEIDQYRKENRDAYNELKRVKYALKIDQSEGRAVRGYVTGLSEDEMRSRRKAKESDRVWSLRAQKKGLSAVEIAEGLVKRQAKRKRNLS